MNGPGYMTEVVACGRAGAVMRKTCKKCNKIGCDPNQQMDNPSDHLTYMVKFTQEVGERKRKGEDIDLELAV